MTERQQVFRRSKRQLLVTVPLLVLDIAALDLVIKVTGVDGTVLLTLLVMAAALLQVVAVLTAFIRVGPDGIRHRVLFRTRDVQWSQVEYFAESGRPSARAVYVKLRGSWASVRPAALRRAPLESRDAQRQRVELLQQIARVPVRVLPVPAGDQRSPVAPEWRLAAVALVPAALVALLLTGIKVWNAPWWPGGPAEASSVPDACSLIPQSGALQTVPGRPVSAEAGRDTSYCSWGAGPPARVRMRIEAWGWQPVRPHQGLELHDFDGRSGVETAREEMRSRAASADSQVPERVPGLGDEAFRDARLLSVSLVVRRSNVIVSIDYPEESSQGVDRGAAEDLVRVVLAEVRFNN